MAGAQSNSSRPWRTITAAIAILVISIAVVVVTLAWGSRSLERLAANEPVAGNEPSQQIVQTTPVQLRGDDGDAGITVTGTGRVTVTPDIGIFEAGVQASAPSVAQARNAAAAMMEQVQSAILATGVAPADIRTVRFSIYPDFRYRADGEPDIRGYIVSNSVEVRVRTIDRLSAVIDAATRAGGNAAIVDGIRFEVDERERYATEARGLAIEDARSRAQQLADFAGVELGSIRAITEHSGGFTLAREFNTGGNDRAEGSTPISPGAAEVIVTVSVVFSIE